MVRLYHDCRIPVERDQKTQKAFDGKLPELTVQHFGNVRLPDAEQTGGLGLFQAALALLQGYQSCTPVAP